VPTRSPGRSRQPRSTPAGAARLFPVGLGSGNESSTPLTRTAGKPPCPLPGDPRSAPATEACRPRPSPGSARRVPSPPTPAPSAVQSWRRRQPNSLSQMPARSVRRPPAAIPPFAGARMRSR
jgi:hypothetical protein